MAQYLAISGSSFGNAHSDNPTYAFSVGTGDIFLSGSGGYVNTPTGITKATLTAGIKLKVTDDSISAVTCSVEEGFTCTGTIAYATLTLPSPTPTTTPTPSPVISSVTLELLAAAYEGGTWPEYTVVITMNGYKTLTRVVQQTDANQVTDNFDMILTGTPDGTGTITVSRTSPDATVADATAITIGQGDGFTTAPTIRTYLTGDTITNASFSVTGFNHGEDMTINIGEG